MRRHAIAIAAAALCCSPALADEVDYVCDDGTKLDVEFGPPGGSGDGFAKLDFEGASPTVTLPHVMSGSGAR